MISVRSDEPYETVRSTSICQFDIENSALSAQNFQTFCIAAIPALTMIHRYAIRKNADNQYWSVYDVATDAPALVDTEPMDTLEEHEARDVLELVTAAFVVPDVSHDL